jgi:hypothetical protein
MGMPAAWGRTLLVAVGIVLQVAAVVRFSQDPEGSAAALDLVAKVDQDGDGQIDAAEYARVNDGELAFEYVDADADGRLAPWEVDVILRSVSPLRASMAWVPRAL